MGMDVGWPYKKRELGDEIVYSCPSGLLTWEQSLAEQSVRCVWHRQTDTMHWWPQDLHKCNSKYWAGIVELFFSWIVTQHVKDALSLSDPFINI